MADFKCTSLHTIYSSVNRTNGWKREKIESAACYGNSLAAMGSNYTNKFEAEYHIMLMKDPSYMDINHANNYCPFDKHFVYCYLRRISRVKAFKFHVEESNFRGCQSYRIDLVMTGTRPEFTFVLQSIKRLYEYPYCIYLLEAKRMQEIPEFKFDSIFNLFNAVASYYNGEVPNTGHSYSCSSIAVPVRVLKERLSKAKFATDVYKYRELSCYHKCPTDTDSFSEETFGTRLPGYIKNLKALSK